MSAREIGTARGHGGKGAGGSMFVPENLHIADEGSRTRETDQQGPVVPVAGLDFEPAFKDAPEMVHWFTLQQDPLSCLDRAHGTAEGLEDGLGIIIAAGVGLVLGAGF